MARAAYTRDFTDEAGNLLTGTVQVEMRREDDGTLPQLYPHYDDDDDPMGNPASFDGGSVALHAAGGLYRVTVTVGAYSRVLRHQPVGLLAGADADAAALRKDQNLADLPDASAARTSLGLGDAATKDVGTGAGDVAGGNDSRITGALQADTEDQVITGGARVTPKDLGNLSGASITPDPGDRPIQKVTNNGAGSILPGSNNGQYTLTVINTTGAGAITTTGWTLKGDSFDTTTSSKFACSCIVTADLKLMTVVKVA